MGKMEGKESFNIITVEWACANSYADFQQNVKKEIADLLKKSSGLT